MENSRKVNSEDDNSNPKNAASGYGNIQAAQNESVKTPGNESFQHAQNDPNPHIGSEILSEKYNINDKAHHDSSAEDFVKTVSNFHHAEPKNGGSESDTSGDSRNHS